MSITVITPTMPGRESLLADAVASVRAQTIAPDDHLIAIDHRREGGWRPMNLLAGAVRTDWIAVLNDDDVFYPRHLERLAEAATEADVVYSWCDVSGADPWLQYNRPFDAGLLRRLSIVSHNALIRTTLWRQVGGWDALPGYDWRFWVKCLDAGARFACIQEPTWRYRLEAGWWHESRPWLGEQPA